MSLFFPCDVAGVPNWHRIHEYCCPRPLRRSMMLILVTYSGFASQGSRTFIFICTLFKTNPSAAAPCLDT